MDYTITYYSEAVEDDVLALPAGLLARYLSLTDRMVSATGILEPLQDRRIGASG